jgi:hypothetical protein
MALLSLFLSLSLYAKASCLHGVQKAYYYSGEHRDHPGSFSKARVQSVFDPRVSTASYRPGVVGHDVNDTEFEEDYSDYEEYSGRRSEDSASPPALLPRRASS